MDGGILSQDEINALLNGMDLSGDIPPGNIEDIIPGEGSGTNTNSYVAGTDAVTGGDELLTDMEKDAIGEVANISMGSSATSLYTLVNHKVDISTPVVSLSTWDQMMQDYEKPCVFVEIKYTKGLDGSNILVLKEHDVKIIADLMMGGSGIPADGPLEEMHLSAISEAMNMMMGASATSLSTMLKTIVDISPPNSSVLDLDDLKAGEEIAPFLGGTFVKINFRMQIGDLVDSRIMQLYPVEFAKKLVETFVGTQIGMESPGNPTQSTPAPASSQTGQAPQNHPVNQGINMGMNNMGMNNMGMNNMGMNGMSANGMGMSGMDMGMPNVNVQPAQFQTFSQDIPGITGHENINLIMDVPLEVTVELGRTSKSISDILNFAPGTIIELNRIAGEPIDVLVNGKFVAKGEVVVIEESFGVRVTEIIK